MQPRARPNATLSKNCLLDEPPRNHRLIEQSLSQAPSICKIPVNLWTLWSAVYQRGGAESVIAAKQWGQISTTALGLREYASL